MYFVTFYTILIYYLQFYSVVQQNFRAKSGTMFMIHKRFKIAIANYIYGMTE